MAKFKFRLETLNKIRLAQRDQQRAALAEAFRAEEVLRDRREDLNREQRLIRDNQRQVAEEPILDVNRMLEMQRYELVLKSQDQELTKQEILLAAEIERRRQALIEADRDARVLEKLEEKQRRAHQREARRLETKQLDELAIARRRR